MFEFTSDRKMMSIIVQDRNGKVFVFAKGADMAMIRRLKDSQSSQVA